jgi:hypothetical protein
MRSLVLAMLALAACGPMNRNAAGNNTGNGSDSAQTEMVCHDVRDTGSLMAHQECQPRNHTTSDDDKKDTEIMLGKPRSQPTANH